MKKLMIFALMAMLVPASAMAMKDMGQKGQAMEMGQGGMQMDKKMEQGSMQMDKKMEQGSMGMAGVMMLQEEVVDGVKGAAHLMDAKDGKGKMLMVMFTNAKTGAMISDGRCAVKVETPDGKVGEAQKMMKNNGMFGAAVSVEHAGVYKFTVGTKLSDGKKRTFNFSNEGK